MQGEGNMRFVNDTLERGGGLCYDLGTVWVGGIEKVMDAGQFVFGKLGKCE